MFFFGAGASAPFGIPTMKQFVGNFENYLNENADKDERELYSDIKSTLEKKIHRPPDLEAVFTVIDGIISYEYRNNTFIRNSLIHYHVECRETIC